MAKATADIRKQVWKFQEGIVVLALKTLGWPQNQIHWHSGAAPLGMSIQPDVIIGDINKPDIIFFVTHASDEKGSDKKFWRGVAEVIEAKRLDSHPRLVNILFEGQSKVGLRKLNENLYDGFVHLADKNFGLKFSDALMSLASEYGLKTQDECLEILNDAVKSKLIPGYQAFCKAINLATTCQLGSHHSVLSANPSKSGGRVVKAKNTAYRRGLAKLFTLPRDLIQGVAKSKKIACEIPKHAIILGWFQKHVHGYLLEDDDLQWIFLNVSIEEIEYVIDRALRELPVFVQYAEALQDIDVLSVANAWINHNFELLTNNASMSDALERVYLKPNEILSEVGVHLGKVRMHWLVVSIMSALRTETGRADGYGYSKLGQETGRRKQLNSAPTDFVPYLQLRSNIEADFREDIAEVFSKHCKRLGKVRLFDLLTKSIDTTAKSIFNYQISGYRHFNPVLWVLESHLKSAAINYIWPASHNSFLSDHVSGNSSATGNMIYISERDIWIKSQSAYDGRIDKRKELCGRIAAMKLTYKKKALNEVDFILVVDGHFDDEDINLLYKAGWDQIFYPYEMSKLINFILQKEV